MEPDKRDSGSPERIRLDVHLACRALFRPRPYLPIPRALLLAGPVRLPPHFGSGRRARVA